MEINDIINIMEEIAPINTAIEGDNVGLLIGDKHAKVSKVLVALEATTKVINEAINEKVDLIITHHPIIFGKINKINTDTILGEKILSLIKNNISVYSAHTNLDIAKLGTNELLCKKLNLNNIIIPENVSEIVRIGKLNKKISLENFTLQVKDILNLENIRFCGDKNKLVEKIAVCTGSGISFMNKLNKNDFDVYLTGDLKYHDAQDAVENGILLVDATHFGSEIIIVDSLIELLSKKCANIEFIKSRVEFEVFNNI